MYENSDLAGKKCVKCDLDAKFTGVDPKKAWYCKDCFIQMVRNKFRSALSKRKIFKDAESRDCLVVYDGTASAAFLLHQIDDALRQVNFKRLMIQPTMLVLVSVTDPAKIALVIERVKTIKEVLFDKVKWIIAHVSCCIAEVPASFGESTDVCYGVEQIPQFQEFLSSFNNQTYKEEIERISVEKCLQNISKWIEISKVMIPDEADILGRSTLSQLCLGRGGSLSTLTSVVDKREQLTIIRPLRDISKKEIAIVNYLCGFDGNTIPIKDLGSTSSSIQHLTSDFVQTLENEKFYSTINTVLSTAGKIHGNDEGKHVERCVLCEIETREVRNLCETCDGIKQTCSNLKIFDRFVL